MPGDVQPQQPPAAAQPAQPTAKVEPPKPTAPDYQALHAQSAREVAEAKAALDAVKRERETERLNALKERKRAEQEEAGRRANPAKHLESIYGPDWYDTVTKAKTGTVSPAGVSSAVTEAEQRLEARFAEREQAMRAELQGLRQLAEDQMREKTFAQAADYVRGNAEKYPHVAKVFKQEGQLGEIIEAHLMATRKRNPDGSWGDGELWTHEQAAQALESQLKAMADMVREYDKAAARSNPPAPAAQPRLTIIPEQGDGTRQAEPQTEQERMERALAAWNAKVAAKKSTHPN